MPRNRTKRGTPIRSTLGMKTQSHIRNWILVADRARLCLFEKLSEPSGSSLELVEEFSYPDGRKKGSELVSDRPGRSFDSHDITRHGQTGGVRHSYGSALQPKDHATETLVAHAVQIAKGCQKRNVQNHFTVVAEPRLMGMLHPAISRATPRMQLSFHEKDFAWLKRDNLKRRLNQFGSENE